MFSSFFIEIWFVNYLAKATLIANFYPPDKSGGYSKKYSKNYSFL